MKNKLLLKGKRRSKRKICLGMLNINIWKSGTGRRKKIWCWRFSAQDVNTKIESNNNLDANEQNDKICFDSSDLQSNHCN